MLTIIAVTSEQDFQTMCGVESAIAQHSDFSVYSTHPSHLVYDRYLFGNGAQDIFTYGKLVINDGIVIGYVLAYLVYPDETQFTVRLLPQYSDSYKTVIKGITDMFPNKNTFTIIANSLNNHLCDALIENRFICGSEERWQSGLDLRRYKETDVVWRDEVIKFLSETDIDDRVKFADIPTGKSITRNMYESLMSSDYYNTALDYVVRSSVTNEFIGFIAWWIDESSKTATLEPVACLPEFRRQAIMKRALFHVLNELKRRGLQYAYVSTSIRNEKSQPLYHSVGFQKIGTGFRYVKENAI